MSELTQTERRELLAMARRLEADFDQMIGETGGPGAFETVGDRELACALELAHGHGVADQTAGDTDYRGHGIRVGRACLFTDSAGFRELTVYDTEAAAERVLDSLEVD